MAESNGAGDLVRENQPEKGRGAVATIVTALLPKAFKLYGAFLPYLVYRRLPAGVAVFIAQQFDADFIKCYAMFGALDPAAKFNFQL